MRGRQNRDDLAVSEVIGVVMLLAMIVSVMAGVWIFLQPYVKEFQDNTNWASANGIADRLEDRFAVVGVAPEGVGIRQTLSVVSTQVIPIINSESWEGNFRSGGQRGGPAATMYTITKCRDSVPAKENRCQAWSGWSSFPSSPGW